MLAGTSNHAKKEAVLYAQCKLTFSVLVHDVDDDNFGLMMS
jgi:hypothetical protein